MVVNESIFAFGGQPRPRTWRSTQDETAVFGVFCRRFGVPLIDGGTVRLPRLIGLSIRKEF